MESQNFWWFPSYAFFWPMFGRKPQLGIFKRVEPGNFFSFWLARLIFEGGFFGLGVFQIPTVTPHLLTDIFFFFENMTFYQKMMLDSTYPPRPPFLDLSL